MPACDGVVDHAGTDCGVRHYGQVAHSVVILNIQSPHVFLA